jgi:hypothetical protein
MAWFHADTDRQPVSALTGPGSAPQLSRHQLRRE